MSFLWTGHMGSPAPFHWLSVYKINGLWPNEANGKTLISRWFLQWNSPWRGWQWNGICDCLSALIILLYQIPIRYTHAPLEVSICKFYKEMQFCVLHRLPYLPTGLKQNWFRSKLKALPVPINHLSSRSVFAAATTYIPWAPIHLFVPPKVTP